MPGDLHSAILRLLSEQSGQHLVELERSLKEGGFPTLTESQLKSTLAELKNEGLITSYPDGDGFVSGLLWVFIKTLYKITKKGQSLLAQSTV